MGAHHYRRNRPWWFSSPIFDFLATRVGFHLPYLDVFLGSLSGVLGLIFVLKKHYIPVRGLPD